MLEDAPHKFLTFWSPARETNSFPKTGYLKEVRGLGPRNSDVARWGLLRPLQKGRGGLEAKDAGGKTTAQGVYMLKDKKVCIQKRTLLFFPGLGTNLCVSTYAHMYIHM